MKKGKQIAETKKLKKEMEVREQDGRQKPTLEDVYDQLIFLRDSIRAVGRDSSLTIDEAFGEGAAIILDRLAEDVGELMQFRTERVEP